MNRRTVVTLTVVTLLAAALVASGLTQASPAAEPAQGPLTVVVMDPLSAPLACDCVQGYAQRKYEKLGEYLTQKLRRPVQVVWSESLVAALKDKTSGKADLVIGKHSVVLHDAKEAQRRLTPLAALTGKDGATTQTGLIVVRSADAAKTVADLSGYRIFFGPVDCDEKSLAPMTLLVQHGVKPPQPLETSPACSNAVATLLEVPAGEKAAAVISSYAAPLLEGCGTVKKGDVRVIGTSDPVPFITAFVNDELPKEDRAALQQALLDVGTQADLLIALETGAGFVEFKELPAPGSQPAEDRAVSQSDAKKRTDRLATMARPPA